MKRTAAGEAGALIDAMLLNLERSNISGQEGGGWGETLSEQAVAELHEWLGDNDAPLPTPPPPAGRSELSPPPVLPIVETGVELGGSRMGRHPCFAVEKQRSEKNFKSLSLV